MLKFANDREMLLRGKSIIREGILVMNPPGFNKDEHTDAKPMVARLWTEGSKSVLNSSLEVINT